jgi:hypothetical protein
MPTLTYNITHRSIDFVARIAEKVGELKGSGKDECNLRLRKINLREDLKSLDIITMIVPL